MYTHQRKLAAALSLCAAVAVPGLSVGALVDRGGGLIYDADLDITWLADANYARTSGYSVHGVMDWASANTWAADLSYFDSVRGVTYDDWRLPATLQPDPSCSDQFSPTHSLGYNCTGSEMGHLFYNELGGVAGEPIQDTHNDNYSLFSNIQASPSDSDVYWSAAEADANNAWYFDFFYGFQDAEGKFFCCYAWAVRDGDVAVVPVPGVAWLFGSGLLGLVGMSGRRRC